MAPRPYPSTLTLTLARELDREKGWVVLKKAPTLTLTLSGEKERLGGTKAGMLVVLKDRSCLSFLPGCMSGDRVRVS